MQLSYNTPMSAGYTGITELILQLSGGGALFIFALYRMPFSQEVLYASMLLYVILVFLPRVLKRSLIARISAVLPAAAILWAGYYYPVLLFLCPASIIPACRLNRCPSPAVLILSALPLVQIPDGLRWYYGIAVLSQFILYLFLKQRDKAAASSAARIQFLEQDAEKKNRLIETLEREARNIEMLSAMEERARLAAALHDRLGHIITGSIMQLQAAETVGADDFVRCMKHIQSTGNTLQEGMNEIRNILRKEVPLDEEVGLRRLRKVLDHFSEISCFETALHTEGAVDAIPLHIWSLIHDGLKEAVTNASKYSNGSIFECKIEVLNRIIRAEYRDNGLSFGHIVYGMGLQGMEHRVVAANGTMLTDNTRGFTITLLFPVEKLTGERV